MLILTMELLLYAALVTILQIRTKTLTVVLSSLNFHLPCKYVAQFIVVIKNILKIFPRMKQASWLYRLKRFFAIKGINRQLTSSLNLGYCAKMLSLCSETAKGRGPTKNFTPGPLVAPGAPGRSWFCRHVRRVRGKLQKSCKGASSKNIVKRHHLK